MMAELEISLGGGRAALRLNLDWRSGTVAGRRLGVVALLLVSPIVVLLGAQAFGVITGWYSLDRLLNAPGGPWVYLLTAGTAAVVLALIVVLGARLRIAAERAGAARCLRLTLRLTAVETLAIMLAAALMGLFVVHLVADGLACARGVSSAC